MPLAGGPADKEGNRYERLWTALQLLDVLSGRATSIRLEDPGFQKAEFVVARENCLELHQVKLSAPSGNWSISALAGSRFTLVQAIGAALIGTNCRFVFVSSSHAKGLDELSKRAKSAHSVVEFEKTFLSSKDLIKDCALLRHHWGNPTPEAVLSALKRIDVRTMDLQTLQDTLQSTISAMFLDLPESIHASLHALIEASVHKTLDSTAILTFLETRGHRLRRLPTVANATLAVHSLTASYLSQAQSRFILGAAIPNPEALQIRDFLLKDSHSKDIVITGPAGYGKSACTAQLVSALCAASIPVLAIRLDKLASVTSSYAIGQQLDLEESPAHVIAAAGASHGAAVLVIDQLDYVSATSGRSGHLIDAVDQMLSEVRCFRDRLTLHVVICCRSFDWEHDPRLRTLASNQLLRVVLAPLPQDIIHRVLTTAGYVVNSLNGGQLKLLSEPQNLALLLSVPPPPGELLAFESSVDLFDRYWNAKRRSVQLRAGAYQDQWIEIVRLLCDRMTEAQALAVPLETLDGFAPAYVNAMISEGVVVADNRRVSFGHESFFDYCYARLFTAHSTSFVDSITSREQHLFVRAQVRQVILYLRDTTPERYSKEMSALLAHPKVRWHIKDLLITLVASIRNPNPRDWAIIAPLVDEHLASITTEQRPNSLTDLGWDAFFNSDTLFPLEATQSRLRTWLSGSSSAVNNTAVMYIRAHQREFPDIAAALLEPFVGRSREWDDRLTYVMQWAEIGASRRFFDLFLNLIERGVLDDARGPIAVNSTFWDLVHGLDKTHPEWMSEVFAHWLSRRASLKRKASPGSPRVTWRDLFGHDHANAEQLMVCAANAPTTFSKLLLPLALTIAEDSKIADFHPLPIRDSVWTYLSVGEGASTETVFLDALALAIGTLNAPSNRLLLDTLRASSLYIANYVLLSVYRDQAAQYADEAAHVIVTQPWRLDCGYEDSRHWVARQLLERISPLCTAANLVLLEDLLLHYYTAYEKSAEGRHSLGHAQYTLLSALDVSRARAPTIRRLAELNRKFGAELHPPRGIRAYSVVSPISENSAQLMTDAQWLNAIATYSSAWRSPSFDMPARGGARELAMTLKGIAQANPSRFCALARAIPATANKEYLDAILSGVTDSDADKPLKCALAAYAFEIAPSECGSSIANLIGSIAGPIDAQAATILQWIATEHPDPSEDLWQKDSATGKFYSGDILTFGYNCTRGRAALAVGKLLFASEENWSLLLPTVELLVRDASLSVRACTAYALLSIGQRDMFLATRLLLEMTNDSPQLLSTTYAYRLLSHALPKHFHAIRPALLTLLGASESVAKQQGASLVALAYLHSNDCVELLDKALNGDEDHRAGVASVAAANLALEDCRSWCEPTLYRLFEDESPAVRKEAASCFSSLSNRDLEPYAELISTFCRSRAFADDSYGMLRALESSSHKIPGISAGVCEQFLSRFGAEARDIRTARAGEVRMLSKLILRTYQQHQRDDWAARCLDLIDHLCLSRLYDVKKDLAEFDR